MAVVFVGVFFTSFSAIFARSTGAPAIATAMYRMWFSVFLLLPLWCANHLRAAGRRRRYGLGGKGKRAASQTPTGDAQTENSGTSIPPARMTSTDGALCILSGLFLAAHFWIWFESLKLTSIASSTVLVNTHPLFVLTFGFLLLKEKVTKRAVFFVFLAFLGMIVLSLGDFSRGLDTLAGDLLAVVSALSVGAYMLIGRKVRRQMNALTYVVVVYFAAAASLTLVSVATGVPLFGYNARDYLMFFCMAFFCTLLGHTLFNWALRYLKTSFISTSVLLEPLFATILGMIIFREFPGATTLAGGGVVLFGVFMFVREEGRSIRKQAGRMS